jgi:hypothetical protein
VVILTHFGDSSFHNHSFTLEKWSVNPHGMAVAKAGSSFDRLKPELAEGPKKHPVFQPTNTQP